MDKTEQFVRLQTESQQRIFSFIRTLIYHWSDAEEILQETNITLWRKREEFDLSTDFVRWANQIAYYKVLNFRKKNKQRQKFSDFFVEKIAEEMLDQGDFLREQNKALEKCLEKLPQKDMEVIHKRYFEGIATREVADILGRSARAIYLSLKRIRESLYFCILNSLSIEER